MHWEHFQKKNYNLLKAVFADSKKGVRFKWARYQKYIMIEYDLLKLLPANVILENVLDVGCGAGVTGEKLKKKYGAKNVIGLEVNWE